MTNLLEELRLNRHRIKAMRLRFYIVNSFMLGYRPDYLAALDHEDVDTAQIIWEKHTGLTGP